MPGSAGDNRGSQVGFLRMIKTACSGWIILGPNTFTQGIKLIFCRRWLPWESLLTRTNGCTNISKRVIHQCFGAAWGTRCPCSLISLPKENRCRCCYITSKAMKQLVQGGHSTDSSWGHVLQVWIFILVCCGLGGLSTLCWWLLAALCFVHALPRRAVGSALPGAHRVSQVTEPGVWPRRIVA